MNNCNCPLPRLNMSARGSWADDLSITKGRHNLKVGVYLEYNKKTEPGSTNYLGNYSFGDDANNPLNTGNGYANMLLGAFSTYTELTARVDKDVRHWQNDFYVQDNWRATSRLTLDLGVRFQHSGSDYEVNNNHTGFFPDQWTTSQAGRVYRLTCPTPGVAGNQPCSAANQRSIDPANPTVFLPAALQRQHRAGDRDYHQRDLDGWHLRREGRHILQVPVPRRGAQVRGRVERHGRWQDRDSRVHRHLLQLPAVDRNRGLQLRRRLSGVVQQPDPVCDIRRRRRSGIGRRACAAADAAEHERRRLRSAAREVLQRQRRVPARHRLPHHGGNRVGRQLPVPGRPHRRYQPAPAVCVREPRQSREQHGAQQQLAETGLLDRTPAWDR